MKPRSTTPVSTGLATKAILVAATVLMVVAAPMQFMSKAYADEFDDQINALQAQIDQYQSQAGALGARAQTLQAELDKITGEKNVIQAQVDLSQKQYDTLIAQIKATEKKITENKEALGDTLANMYVSGSVSPLEMLASAENITDYVDQQEYRASISDALTARIDEIKTLKKKLEDSKEKVQVVLEQQKDQRAALAAKEAEQARLVQETRGEEAAYQKLANDARAQQQNAAAQQRAYYASLQSQNGGAFTSGMVGGLNIISFNGNMGCSGGYPYCNGPLDYGVDEWDLYNRECVSYAAWRIHYGYGKQVNSFQGHGMAYEWEWSAPRFSGAVRVSDPQPGDAVVLPIAPGFAPVGHLMVVEGVSGDNVYVSQYNFGGTGEYSTMTISKSGSSVIYLRF